jgi:superfamily I DNA/RNA helicase
MARSPGSSRALLDRLAPDQRAAATAPPGPVLCIAPAGSGKTTTLIARIAWLLDSGADPETITAIAFNKRAADELRTRLASAAGGIGGDLVRVRTFHALGLEMLREAGEAVSPLVDRMSLLRRLWPTAPAAERRRLETLFSRLKLDLRIETAAVEGDADPGRLGVAFVRYERALIEMGGLDYDDLIARPLRLLESNPSALATWRARCQHLLVDEAQDLDRSQLDLALLLALPDNRIFLVGDDDQSIYGWRLADVRRVLGLVERLPGLRRVDLEVNYRCPRPVVERAVRLVSHNTERFAKVVRAGPAAGGRLILAPTSDDDVGRTERLLAGWPDDAKPRAILARTNRELAAAAVAAIEAGRPFRAAGVELVVESPHVDVILEQVATDGAETMPLLARIGRVRTAILETPLPPSGDADDPDAPTPADVAEAVLGWAARFETLEALRAAIETARRRLAELRRDDAALSLATAHSTKGLEFDDVAVIDMDAERFPSARSLSESIEPERALEEERRLAYVAWTRARRSLILMYDPATPSTFLLEAFTAVELGLPPGVLH